MDKWIHVGKLDPDDLQIILDESSSLFKNNRLFGQSGISAKDPEKIKNVRSSLSHFPDPSATSNISQVAFFVLNDYLESVGVKLECHYPQIQLLKYRGGDFYTWHRDLTGTTGEVRLISMSINLNSEYGGGGLGVRRLGTGEVVFLPNEPGSYAIFTSLHEHTALPVTDGERRAITFWFMSTESELARMQQMLKKQPQ